MTQIRIAVSAFACLFPPAARKDPADYSAPSKAGLKAEAVLIAVAGHSKFNRIGGSCRTIMRVFRKRRVGFAN